jgi:hypothetical protein
MGALALHRWRLAQQQAAVLMFSIEVTKTTFAGGEVSPELRVRSDLAKNQTGLWFLENMVVLLEGGITRRPGTRMVIPYKDPSRPGVGIPYRFAGSGSNAYLILLNAGVARFILNASVVVIGGGNNNPYEVAIPYGDGDLTNIRYTASGNVVYLFCDGFAPQTLTRNADNSWTLAPYITQAALPAPQGGCLAPVATENFDNTQTIAVDGTQDVINLNASANFALAAGTVPNGFQAGHVGSVWRLDESTLSLTPEWTSGAAITVPVAELTGTAIGNMANNASAFDQNLATAASAATSTGFVGLNLGAGKQAALINATIQALSGAGGDNAFFNNIPGFDSVNTPLLSLCQFNGQIGYPTNTGGDNNTFNALNSAIFFTIIGSQSLPTATSNGLGAKVLAQGAAGSAMAASVSLSSVNEIATFQYIFLRWTVTSDSIPKPFGGPPNPPALSGQTLSLAEVNFQAINQNAKPTLRRWNGNVYQALSAGNAGSNPPVHTSGAVLSGAGGVLWLYRHRDRGFVQIQSVVSPTQATALVLERIPDSVLAQPTANWWPSAWDGVQGWPNRCLLLQNALWAAYKNKFWRTQPGTFNNWDIVDPASPQSAIAGGLVSPTGALAWIEFFMGGAFLGAGTRDEEWTMVGGNPLAGVSVENLSPYPSRQEGSCVHIPAVGEGGFIAIDKTRKRALFMTIEFGGVVPAVNVEELTLSARHILKDAGGALGVSRQVVPNKINWFWTASGLLVGNTLMKEQQINGWHRHPQDAATNSAVEWVATIPSNDEGDSFTYFGTKRTINGQTARFVELLQPFFDPDDSKSPTAAGAWFLDCALQYQGAPVTTLSGLSHLAGCTVAVHADGCMYLNPDGSLPVVAADGTLALSRATQNAIVGLPIPYRARLLPLDLTTQHGTTAGAKQKANHLFLRVANSAGGAVTVNPDAGGVPENLEPPGTLTYGAPIPLQTDIIRTAGLEAGLDDETIVELTGQFVQTPTGLVECDTMPFTLIAVDPDIVVAESD